MQKLQSARDHLLKSPLGIKAEKLLTFAEKGVITSYRGVDTQNDDFQVRYTAHLIVTDYTGQPDKLFFVMLVWLHKHCPGAKPDALKFHVDIIDHAKVDVSLMLEMTETVTVTTTDGGSLLTPDTDPDALLAALFPGA